MAAVPSGADALANTLLTSLTTGVDFTVPTIDLSDPIFGQPGSTGPIHETIDKIDFDDLTTGMVGGAGVFDKLMVSLVAHLKVEYAANRISGAEYTKAYLGIVSAALQTANQFLLTKDSAYWGALLVQAQAKTAEIETIRARLELETARVLLVRTQYEAATAEVNYGLTKIKIANEDISYTSNVVQIAAIEAQTEGVVYTNANILPAQKVGIDNTNSNLVSQGVGIDFTNANILPKQEELLGEQIEIQRSQTLDTRTDGATVAGSVGKQKDLYTQQITSYQRDSENKAAKMWVDAWITQKTIDEGLLAPDQFTNTNLNAVLLKLRTNVNLDV